MSGSAPRNTAGRGRGLRHRLANLLMVVLLLFIAARLPFVVISLVGDFREQHTPRHSIATIATLLVFGIVTSVQIPQLGEGEAMPWMGLAVQP